MNVLEKYDEVFAIEMEGWCYGIEQYPGEIYPGLVHAVIKELSPAFKAAFEHNFVFDILALSERISKACKYLVHEKEICFSILSRFPNPVILNEDAQFAMAQVIDQVEQHYGGALDRLLYKWESQNKKALQARARRQAAA